MSVTMASTADDSNATSIIDPPVDGSKTASILDPNVDIEKKGLSGVDQPAAAEKSNEFQRSISNTKWYLCCIGLYLGAFLYGKYNSCQLSRHLLMSLAKASTQLSLQMSRLPFLRHSAKLTN
jgi:hypothetical protein